MLKLAVRSGIDAEKFHDLTQREIRVYIENYFENEKQKKDNIISLAWYTAYFSRVEKLQKLDYYLKCEDEDEDDNEIEEYKRIAKKNGLKHSFGGE